MRRSEAAFITPRGSGAATHLARLLRQARLARRWTQAELAERSRVSLATLKRMERGGAESSLGAWLSVYELLGLLPRLLAISDPVSQALLDETRMQRVRHGSDSGKSLDF